MERRLTELPKLSIPSGEAWERNMILNTWIKEVVLATTSVSMPFSDFVAGVFDKARTRYVYQKANPRLNMDSAPPPPVNFRGYNSKLCVILLPAVPEDVKVRVLEEVDESAHLTAVSILDEVWNYVAPGGQDEIEGLTKYIRSPGTASTATEARSQIRIWMHARKRAVAMSIPDLSPFEQVKVLENFVNSVEKKRADFAHRIEIMKFSREGRTPTQEFVMQFQSLIEDELRLVEADELVIQNRRTDWDAH